MPIPGTLRYLDRLGDPFLFLEERFVTVSSGQAHIVSNHLPKAVLILEGTLRHQYGNETAQVLNPGSVLLNFEKHRNTYLPRENGRGGRLRVLRLTLPWDFASRTPDRSQEPGFGIWLHQNLPSRAVLTMPDWPSDSRLFQDLRASLRARDAGRRYRVNALARLVFLRLITTRTPDRGKPAPPANLLGHIENFLENHLAHPVRLQDVARAVDRSEEHIARFFRGHRGTTIFAELWRLRLRRAHYLLLCTDLSLSQIAHQTGFSTLAHFSRMFKDDTGHSPSAYRRHSGFRTSSEPADREDP